MVQAAIEQALNVSSVSQIVVDFPKRPFLDSCGIGALLSARRRGTEQAVTVRIANPGGLVQRVLQIAGMLDTLHR